MIDIWSSWNYDANIVSYPGFPVAHCRRALATISDNLPVAGSAMSSEAATSIAAPALARWKWSDERTGIA
jgi:hypothetical protein